MNNFNIWWVMWGFLCYIIGYLLGRKHGKIQSQGEGNSNVPKVNHSPPVNTPDRQGKDETSKEALKQTSPPAVCECGHTKEEHPLSYDVECFEFKERGER